MLIASTGQRSSQLPQPLQRSASKTVQKLETGGLTLEESLALFERGQALAAHCSVQLDEAELTVRQLSPEGIIPFEPEE